MTIEYLAGNRLRGLNSERTGMTSIDTITKDGSSQSINTSTGGTTLVKSITIGNNSNRILIVSTGNYTTGSSEIVSGVTLGSQNFVKAISRSHGSHAFTTELWYLINPTVGTADITVTWSATAARRGITGTSFYNVDQSSPIGVTNYVDVGNLQQTTVSGTITPTTAGSMIIDAMMWLNGTQASLTLTAGAIQFINNDDRSTGQQYSTTPTIGSANAMNYTASDVGHWIWVGAEIKATTSPLATWTWSNDKTRGVFGGGTTTVDVNTMDYIIISTLGNATDFGDLTVARRAVDGVSSDVRGVFGGGENGSRLNVMDYITIATAGNATDFGNLTVARRNVGGVSSDAGRGVFGGGYGSTYENTMDYITIATLGNAIDFGNLTVARTSPSGCNSDVRGVISGGNGSNVMDYITIATLGNATDFGDLSTASGGTASVNSDVRGVIQNGGDNNIIDYITIATTGNTTDFGDSLQVSYGQSAGVSGTTRGVFGGGYNTSNVSQNYIEYVTIATLGNAIDFGDLSQARAVLAGVES